VLPVDAAAPASEAQAADAAKPKRAARSRTEPKAAEPAVPLLFDLAAPLPAAPVRKGRTTRPEE
jgi:hypothetical protein